MSGEYPKLKQKADFLQLKVEQQDTEIRKLKGILWTMAGSGTLYARKSEAHNPGALVIRETNGFYVMEALPRAVFDGEIED